MPDPPERRLRNYPHEMSGGMRQRVMIAIALACEPDLLIADEPTTALDVTIQRQILDLLRRVQRERGMSMMLISHDLAVVAGRTDRVSVMYAGRLAEVGSTREIFEAPRHRYTHALLGATPDDRPPPALAAAGDRRFAAGSHRSATGMSLRAAVRAQHRRVQHLRSESGVGRHGSSRGVSEPGCRCGAGTFGRSITWRVVVPHTCGESRRC